MQIAMNLKGESYSALMASQSGNTGQLRPSTKQGWKSMEKYFLLSFGETIL